LAALHGFEHNPRRTSLGGVTVSTQPAVPPGNAEGRIAVVDALRAVALFGIIVTHSEFEFLAGPHPSPTYGRVHEFDPLVSQLVAAFASGKFFSIFAFLFGLSFAIQLANATRKGTGFSGRFAWRLTVLLLIGAVHQMFFSGDILMFYALLGLLLIPMRNVRSGILLGVALLLLLNVFGLLLSLLQSGQSPEQQRAAAEIGAQFQQMGVRQFEIKSQGSLAELARMNFGEALAMKVGFLLFTGRLWITFGCFLLGMYAGRIGLFVDSEQNRRRMWRLLTVAGVVALPSTVYVLLSPASPTGPASTFNVFVVAVQQATLSAFYVAAATLLFWRQQGRGLLGALVPMGKMGLTTYLMQTAFGVIVFYGIGFGLMGQLGSGVAVACGISFFVAQAFMARAWLARYSLGPVEWLWRSLTYFRLQPLVRRPVAPTVAVT
jgi:uncharacterized protein